MQQQSSESSSHGCISWRLDLVSLVTRCETSLSLPSINVEAFSDQMPSYDRLANSNLHGRGLTFVKAEIQTLYSTHRVTRNAQQKEKFLSSDFKEVIIDPFLLRIERPKLAEPGFADPRYCLVFWARPPDHVIRLAAHLQAMLKKAAPSKLHSFTGHCFGDIGWSSTRSLGYNVEWCCVQAIKSVALHSCLD